MKFLIHSNGPSLPTGYGVQTALLARRLRDAGHEVAISAYCGEKWGTSLFDGDIQVYPAGFEMIGNDVILQHAEHFFEGDPKAGWIITLTDVFGLVNPNLRNWQVAAWTPVDHFPCPPAVLNFFKATGATPIAMSQYGVEQLRAAGLDPLYVPLSFDPDLYKPTPAVDVNGKQITGRELMEVTDDKFVVMMNGMNKGAGGAGGMHRKGFPEAFLAFAKFASKHQDAVLYLHTEQLGGAGGANLLDLAISSGIAPHQISWVPQYWYRLGMQPEVLAACYTAADVLLAPSRGEGFCVPLIEAQACGTPVIVTDFSAQPELVGAGWKVQGQPDWDTPQGSWMIKADIEGIYGALEAAYEADKTEMAQLAKSFAAAYEADRVFNDLWLPIIDDLSYTPPVLELDREPMCTVDVIVPVLNRPDNVKPLVESFRAAGGDAQLWFVCDKDDEAEITAIRAEGLDPLFSERGSTFAQKVNSGVEQTDASFIFVCGDDVQFQPGWVDAARKLSHQYDVIGSNDASDEFPGNAPVQAGTHADHFFIRREYIDQYGASLDGPGVVCHEGYGHYYVDYEIIGLAKARGVFTPCLDSHVPHLRIGRDDATYRKGAESFKRDQKTWRRRAALIEQQRRR